MVQWLQGTLGLARKGEAHLGFRGSQRQAAGELGGECEEHSPRQRLTGLWEALLSKAGTPAATGLILWIGPHLTELCNSPPASG